jgi:glutathione-regulated potassium-efflux system ancillary protein KefG
LRVDVDDLIDAHEVADVVGLTNKRAVSVYQRRYPDMPRPIVDRGHKRAKLWLRSDVMDWARRSGHLSVRLLLDEVAARTDLTVEAAVEQLWVDRRVQADLALGAASGSVIRDEACTITALVADPNVSRRRDICVKLTALAVGATLDHLRDDSCGPVQAGGS